MTAGGRRWPPLRPCFAPRLGDYLARLEQVPMSSLLAQPTALALAFRRASALLRLEVECLDVPAAWILQSAAGSDRIAAASRRGPRETVATGPLAGLREALRALPPAPRAPATLLALPSPAALARAMGTELDDWPRATLQALVRSLGELRVLAGVLFDDDQGALALGQLLEHFPLTPICVRRPQDAQPLPAGALLARALPLELLARHAQPKDLLLTSDGPVAADVPPESLLQASRALATA